MALDQPTCLILRIQAAEDAMSDVEAVIYSLAGDVILDPSRATSAGEGHHAFITDVKKRSRRRQLAYASRVSLDRLRSPSHTAERRRQRCCR